MAPPNETSIEQPLGLKSGAALRPFPSPQPRPHAEPDDRMEISIVPSPIEGAFELFVEEPQEPERWDGLS